MRNLLLFCAALGIPALLSAGASLQFQYHYPEQPGLSRMQKEDRTLTALTDQDWATGTRCQDATKEWLIDLIPSNDTEVSGVELTIWHVDLPKLSKNSHPLRIQLYMPDSNGEFRSVPEWVFPVPFEAVEYQTVSIPFPGTLQSEKIRLGVIPATNWVKLAEVKLLSDSRPVTEQAKHERPSAGNEEIIAAPVAMNQLMALEYQPSELLGVCGHIQHTNFFFPDGFPPNWELPRTIDSVVQGNFGWVREPLYSPYFLGAADDIVSNNRRSVKENRAQIEHDLALYDRLKVKVLLTPMTDASHRNRESLKSYCDWLIELAGRHPCIKAIEFENEPNIGSLSPEEYAAIVKQMSPQLRSALPDLPQVLGALALWGMHNRYWEENRSPEEWAMKWTEELFQQDVLALVDGVSFHPYRWGTPEGGTPIESPYDENGFRKELHRFADLIAKYNKTKRPIGLYITEIGFSSRSNETLNGRDLSPVVAEQLQADLGGRNLMIALDEAVNGLPIKMLLWYDLKEDPVWSFESGFGLVGENNLYRKPAYAMMHKLATRYANPSEYRPAENLIQVKNQPGWVKTLIWERKATGELVVAFWRMQQYQQFDRDFADGLDITITAGKKVVSVELDSMHEAMPRLIGFTTDREQVTVPVWVTAGVSFITIKFETEPSSDLL